MNKQKIISIVLRLIAAVIMLQTLYFKFTAQPESVYIFSKVGIEPWGRVASGIAELVASVLLLLPTTIALGALVGAGIMLGALAAHVFILGIEVQGDGGQLFIYAFVVLIACVVLLAIHFQQLISYKRTLFKK